MRDEISSTFDELPATVLICEDDRDYAEMLRETLSGTTVKIVGVAYDGRTAVAMWDELRPAALITDLMLPGPVNGPDVIRRIKDLTPDAIVIALTGTGSQDLILEAQAAGAQAVFNKSDYPPTRRRDLEAHVERNGVTYR